MSSETIRYDKEEDRANDIKRHDNPNHSSEHGNKVREAEAQAQQQEQS